jgi:BirA family biotin operon repressor/biotin-[acetyl-CoA-carboxylase] ligase
LVSWTFVELDAVGSTQAVAKDLASKGAPEGTAVGAKSQSSGKGRLGREWVSPVGGLYMSFMLRPKRLRNPELMTLISATAVVEGIMGATELVTNIRWPNDVILKRRKLAGVIAEAQTDKREIAQVIVGIGVNCNAPVSSFNLTTKATSLSEALGKEVDITEIRNAILDSISALYGRWQLGEDMLPIWTEHLSTPGNRIMIKLKTTENPFSCVATEVDPDGGLLVETEGETVLVRPEDLEWLREEP